MQHQAVQHSYRRAFVGTAAIAFLYLLAILVSSRQTQDAFNAGNWGYALGPPVFAMLIGTLIAGYWTNKSSSEASFVRAAMRGGVIALAGQISIAETLRANGANGSDYLRQVREDNSNPLLFLPT